MFSNKKDVQNNMKKNEKLCSTWREGTSLGICDLPAVLKAARELDKMSVEPLLESNIQICA